MLSDEVGNWNSIDVMNWNNWNDCTSVSLFVLGIRTIVELFPDSCLENLSIMENLLQGSARTWSTCIDSSPSFVIPLSNRIQLLVDKITDIWNKDAQCTKQTFGIDFVGVEKVQLTFEKSPMIGSRLHQSVWRIGQVNDWSKSNKEV